MTKPMDEERAGRLLGTPERRIRPFGEFEIRAGTGSTYTVRGYASVVEHPYEVYGGPTRYGWDETIARGAFDVTLAAKPDVSFLINHEGMPLARTKSGTLTLRADSTGLESEAEIDRRDPFGQALEVKMERGDLDQMSFGFRVTRQEWNEEYTDRRITEVSLDHGDVSVVNIPANPATSISITARNAVAVLREMELAELRGELSGVAPDELREAQARLGELLKLVDPRPDRACIDVHVETDDEGAETGPDDENAELSSLISLAVDLLNQAATGLQQQNSAGGDGRARAEATVRRFSQMLAGVVQSTVDAEIETVSTTETGDEGKGEQFTGVTDAIKAALDEQVVVLDADRSAEGTETRPSRSVRAIDRYRALYDIPA